MYDVYIVDDEPLVLEDMKKNIPWLEYNMQVIGEENDPHRAADAIIELKPDIVFTDIQMPRLSGIEMIEIAKERGASCVFVVVSAHERFEYARQLIQLGGFDYLIKPVEEAQYSELLTRLLSRMERDHKEKNRPVTSSEELNAILKYLNRHLNQKHTLGDLAKKFNISPNYICNLFAKHMETTFSTYMTKIRMERAAGYLKDTEKPVKEISGSCGYEDYFYFCRVFREYYSCTPTQYRNRL